MRLTHLVQSVLKPFGFRLARIETSQSVFGLDVFFALLKRMGFAPKQIIDIGANHGNWTRKTIEYFPNASYTLVEPQEGLKDCVKDLIDQGRKIQWIHAGAGDVAGKLPFSVAHRDDSSSFASASADPNPGSGQIEVEVRTLNEIVSSSKMSIPEMVKIDAEGFDLKVLAGASDLFGRTDIFLVEALVCATDYPNSTQAVVQFMANAGYRLIDITDITRSPKDNVLWLCEFAFLRNGSGLLKSANTFE